MDKKKKFWILYILCALIIVLIVFVAFLLFRMNKSMDKMNEQIKANAQNVAVPTEKTIENKGSILVDYSIVSGQKIKEDGTRDLSVSIEPSEFTADTQARAVIDDTTIKLIKNGTVFSGTGEINSFNRRNLKIILEDNERTRIEILENAIAGMSGPLSSEKSEAQIDTEKKTSSIRYYGEIMLVPAKREGIPTVEKASFIIEQGNQTLFQKPLKVNSGAVAVDENIVPKSSGTPAMFISVKADDGYTYDYSVMTSENNTNIGYKYFTGLTLNRIKNSDGEFLWKYKADQ